MGALREAASAFSPRVAAAKACPSLPPYKDLQRLVEAAVLENLGKEPSSPGAPAMETRFVLDRKQYEKIQETIGRVHEESGDAEISGRKSKKLIAKPTYMEPFLVWHSTQNVAKINSVLKHGYLMPGDCLPTELWTLCMAHGNRLGDGIYCSNHFDVSQWYSFIDKTKAIQLIVNILVPGRVGRVAEKGRKNIHGVLQPDEGTYVMYEHSAEAIATGVHTLWGPDLGQWVVGASERLIPVAVVTFTLPYNEHTPILPELNSRLKYMRDMQVRDGASVTFCHINEDLWMVRPASDPRLRPYLDAENGDLSQYKTVFALLATCVHNEFFVPEKRVKSAYTKDQKEEQQNDAHDLSCLQDYVKYYNEYMSSPFDFLRLYREDLTHARRRVEPLEQVFGSREKTKKEHLECMVRLCKTLVEDHGGQVPVSTALLGSVRSLKHLPCRAAEDFLRLARTSPTLEHYVQPFYNERCLDINSANLFLDHYYVLPPSVIRQPEVIRPLQDYIDGLRGKPRIRQFVPVTEHKASSVTCVDVTKGTEALRRLHFDQQGAAVTDKHSDCLVTTLSHLFDRITLGNEEGREQAINVIYLFVRAPPQDMASWDQVVGQYAKYIPFRKVMVKVFVWSGEGVEKSQPSPIKDVCKIKQFTQTLHSSSPNYFWEASNSTQCEECFQAWGDEIDHEVVRFEMETVRFAVSYPFGIAGEGFMPDRPGSVGFQPEWERNVFYGQPLVFQGEKPPYVTQDGQYYPVTTLDTMSSNDITDLSEAIFCLLSSYQGYIFASPERLNIYRYKVEKLARSLLTCIETMDGKESPSLLKGIRYKLLGFLSSIEAFGGVPFMGKWFTNLRSMKFGKQVARRVKKTFDLDGLLREVPFHDQKFVKEPSDVLNFVARKGRMVRVRTSGASEIEPWLVHVDYVSPDTDASTIDMFHAAERGIKVRDSSGHVVTDVLLDNVAGDEVAKLYTGFVFARTPYLYMPSQHPALLVNAFFACVENAFGACVEFLKPQDVSECEGKGDSHCDSGMQQTVRKYLFIAMSMLDKVRERTCVAESNNLLHCLKEQDDVEELLSTKNNIQSVNQVLAALLLPNAASLVADPDKWPRICFGILVEAVARNCRARVRSGKKTAVQLMDRALFLKNLSPTMDFKVNIKKSSQTTNHFMAHSYTNCSPFKVVGGLFFVQFIHKQMPLNDIVASFIGGEAAMGRFLRDNLPGFGGYVTQLALYLQGLQRETNRQELNRQFTNPRGIVNSILRERLDHYEIVRARATRSNHRAEHRRNVRIAEAQPYRRYHTVPRLFTPAQVKKLNASRPVNDQLVLLPHGLLLHHCCYPDCPDFLRNFETENDRKSGRRRGLFAHLRHSRLLGNLHSGFSRNMHQLTSRHNTSNKATVFREMRQLYPNVADLHIEICYNLYTEHLSGTINFPPS